MQFDVGHANGGHLTGGIGQAPPGTIGVIVGLLAVDNGYEAGSGFLGADDTGGGQCIAELFAVCGVKGQDGAFAIGTGDGEGDCDGSSGVLGGGDGSGLSRCGLGNDLRGYGLGGGGGCGRPADRRPESGSEPEQKAFSWDVTSLKL